MPLFPQLPEDYMTDTDRSIRQMAQAFYTQAYSVNQVYWYEADMDTRFNAGDQRLWNDIYGNVASATRKNYNFNHIMPINNLISGHQRRNRKSIIAIPRENADQKTSDQFTKVFSWEEQQCGLLETYSDAAYESLVTGMSLLQFWLDFRDDPINGQLKVDHCHYNSFLIDPYFRKKDLSDCNGLMKRTYLTKREAMSLLPEHEDDIANLATYSVRDGKFQFMPENYNMNTLNLLAYDEFWYRDFRKQKKLVDTETGETLEWKSQDDEMLQQVLAESPNIQMIECNIPTVKLAIMVQGKVFYDGPNPLGIDRYPFVGMFCYFYPQLPYFPWRIQGVVRGLRDVQYLYNRQLIIQLDILESQMNSGWIVKENALVNPKDTQMTGQGRTLWVKQESSLADVQKIEAGQIPPSWFQASGNLGTEFNKISGASEELLGQSDGKIGIVEMLRQGAGLTQLQPIFDNWDYALKQCGEIMRDVVQTNYTPGKIARIVQEEPAPQFYNKAFGKYDIAIEEGLNTTTQKQMQFAQMMELREMLGDIITPDMLLKAATLQNKDEVIKEVQQRQEAQQQQAQMAQEAQVREVQARTELAEARAIADRGLGVERVSRVQENQALADERRAQAVRDHYGGLLDLAKALKELEEADIGHIEKLIGLSQMIKMEEMAMKATDEAQTESTIAKAGQAVKPAPAMSMTQ